ncbi:MAG: 50S ribosomal protein L35 [Elusimicrobiota bacterium]
MPKLKSHSGAKKRFKFTARGKVKYKRAGARHLLQGMSSSRSRFLRRPDILNETQTKMIKKILPYG